MNITTLERIKTLLENYDKKLQAEAEAYANGMADWADTSQIETISYAKMYDTIRVERQRVKDSIFELEMELNKNKGKEERNV